MKLHAAIKLAEAVQRELQPFCQRIEIAGSIRRGREVVNDIDFVILPMQSTVHSPQSTVQEIKDRCKQKCRVITDGRQNFICAMRLPAGQEFQIDIFFAHSGVADLLAPEPSNFGSLLLCRTGSKDHNIKLAQRAKDLDMHWNPYRGLFAGGVWELDGQESVYHGGKLIASESEEQIFQALGLEWVAPAYRQTTFDGQVQSPESTVFSRGAAETAAVPGVNAVQGEAA
jgi:DNA polymerase/3'-5' exonuclease PolX